MSRNFSHLLSAAVFVVGLGLAAPTMAGYSFSGGEICNGYDEARGYLTHIAATTTYKEKQGFYLQLRTLGGADIGGHVYWRNTQDWAYNHMIRMAILAHALQAEVRLCYETDAIYALELSIPQ